MIYSFNTLWASYPHSIAVSLKDKPFLPARKFYESQAYETAWSRGENADFDESSWKEQLYIFFETKETAMLFKLSCPGYVS